MTHSGYQSQHFADRQADVLRLADARYDLSINRLSKLTDIPEATLRSWKNGTAMPAWAMVELAKHIPTDLMNMLVERSGLCFAAVEKADSGLDQLACETSGFTHELLQAKADGHLTPTEKAALKERARRVAAAAANVA